MASRHDDADPCEERRESGGGKKVDNDDSTNNNFGPRELLDKEIESPTKCCSQRDEQEKKEIRGGELLFHPAICKL